MQISRPQSESGYITQYRNYTFREVVLLVEEDSEGYIMYNLLNHSPRNQLGVIQIIVLKKHKEMMEYCLT